MQTKIICYPEKEVIKTVKYKLTNISGGQIVCDLATGDTLRLNYKESQTITEEEMTPYIRNLEAKGLMIVREVTSSKSKKK